MSELVTSIWLLTRAIETQPGEPVNYLLRGEQQLVQGLIDEARDDFLAARERAERLLPDSAWGYLYQAYIDRANAGLRECGDTGYFAR